MSLQLTEPIVSALVSRLGDPLNAVIDALNLELADDITVAYPARVVDHFPPLATMTTFPQVAVAEGPGSFQDDTGYSATGVYQLVIRCYVSDADQQRLATKLRRLRLAVARTVLANRVIPTADGSTNAAWGVRLVRIDPGQTLGDLSAQGKVTSFMSWCGLVIEAMTDEDA